MTVLAKTSLDLRSKKSRQLALSEKIAQIDAELEKLGAGNLAYTLSGSITNPETPQNSIVIHNITDMSFLFRLLAYYNNIATTKKEYIAKNNIQDFVLKNCNSFEINDVILDLNLRIHILANQNKINVLTVSKQKLLPFLDEESRFVSSLKEIEALLKTIK